MPDEERKATEETPTQQIRGFSMEWQIMFKRLDDLAADLKEVKASVNCIDDNQEQFILAYTKAHEALENRVVILEKDTKTNTESIKELRTDHTALEKRVEPLVFMSKIWMAIAGLFMTSVIALLWAIFTHAVSIVPRIP